MWLGGSYIALVTWVEDWCKRGRMWICLRFFLDPCPLPSLGGRPENGARKRLCCLLCHHGVWLFYLWGCGGLKFRPRCCANAEPHPSSTRFYATHLVPNAARLKNFRGQNVERVRSVQVVDWWQTGLIADSWKVSWSNSAFTADVLREQVFTQQISHLPASLGTWKFLLQAGFDKTTFSHLSGTFNRCWGRCICCTRRACLDNGKPPQAAQLMGSPALFHTVPLLLLGSK